MAGRGREILLRIVGDGDDAKRKLAEVTTDLREFGQLNAEARADIKTQGAEAKLQVLRDRLFRLGQQEATPKVQIATAAVLAQIERIEAQLEKLDHKRVNVDVDVSRGGAERAAGVFGTLVGVLGSVGRVAAGVVGSFGNVGGSLVALTGRGAAFLPILALIVVGLGALAASALSAVAGLGALAVAFAGVVAPVAILAVVALPRLVAIFKALHERHTQATQDANAVAAAQDGLASAHEGVRSATEGLADAQQNLRDQTQAAWGAFRQSVEDVKDSILAVQHAQLGIEQADLRRDQARLRLRQLLRESGVDQGQVQGLTQKAQDVNFQQDPGALAKLLRGAGAGEVGREKQLEIRQALLDVKDATLGVKDANDRLHDANQKLKDDERVRAQFARQGIAAYRPYRDAVRQVTTAQRGLVTANRQLASAQRAQIAATVAQGQAWKDLSPAEQRLALTFERIGKRIKAAFGPALTAVFTGLASGLDAATKSLADSRVTDAITGLGRAVGETFAAFGRELARPETRDAFVELAQGAADLMRELGQKAAIDAFRLLLRVARAALPDLVDLMRRFVGWLDGLERGSRNSRNLRRDIKNAIGEAKGWIDTFIAIANALKDFLDFSRNAWRAIGDFIELRVNRIRKLFSDLGDFFGRVGSGIGRALRNAVAGLPGFFKGQLNEIIRLLNWAIDQINGVTPGPIKVLGKTITPGVPDLPHIPELASGGIALRDTLARIGEAGREAVIPLRADVLSALGQAIAVATPQMALAGTAAAAGAGRSGGPLYGDVPVSIVVPGGGPPDPEMLAANLERVLRRRGRG